MNARLIGVILEIYKKYAFFMIPLYLIAGFLLGISQIYQGHIRIGQYILSASLIAFTGTHLLKVGYWWPIKGEGKLYTIFGTILTLPMIFLFPEDEFEIANFHLSITLWFLIGFVITFIFWNRIYTMKLHNLGSKKNKLNSTKNIKDYLNFLNATQPNQLNIYDVSLLPHKKDTIKRDLLEELMSMDPFVPEDSCKEALMILAQFQKGVGPVSLTKKEADVITLSRYEDFNKLAVKEKERPFNREDISSYLRMKEEYYKNIPR